MICGSEKAGFLPAAWRSASFSLTAGIVSRLWKACAAPLGPLFQRSRKSVAQMCFSCNHLVSAITVSQRSESVKKSFIDKNELIEKSYGSQMSENSNHGDERTSLQCRQKLDRKKQRQTPFCVKNCFKQGKIRIQSTHSAKSAMPMAFPSMKWILPWQVKNFTQKSNVAPMAAEKIPRRLKGKMTSMSCFWQR